ncbi:hypothetical protein [Nonomuraea jiangxiensis]|nr:hypothetical protein [Nonomuraea jiangxiensis]
MLVSVSTAASASPAPVPAPAPESAGDDLTVLDGTGTPENDAAAAALCLFTTNGDYVHVSSSAFEASGHGWWVNINCSTATAVVTVQLQQYYSDGVWRNKGTVGRSTVRSGGGAGNRATGRGACTAGSALTGWRSVIDVDLVGLADDPGKLTTSTRNINCRRA